MEENLTQVAEHTKDLFHIDEISKYLTVENITKVIVSIISIVLFYIFYRFLKRIIKKQASVKFEKNTVVLINKTISYIFYVLIGMYILGLFGINLKAIWGAAGVAGLAIGFAAQTSVSNFISGLFVLSEKALKIGDFISIGDTSGTVETVGLLSVKIRTADNQLVRIPNSSIINNNLMNHSTFSTKRFVFEIPISHETDLTKALEVIKKVPDMCPTVLKDPAPLIFYDGFGDAIKLMLSVWFNRADLIQTKNDVYINIVKICKEENIVIPYAHYDIRILNEGIFKK